MLSTQPGTREVLVAILNHQGDLATLRNEGWYRIPVRSVEKWLSRASGICRGAWSRLRAGLCHLLRQRQTGCRNRWRFLARQPGEGSTGQLTRQQSQDRWLARPPFQHAPDTGTGHRLLSRHCCSEYQQPGWAGHRHAAPAEDFTRRRLTPTITIRCRMSKTRRQIC